MFRRSVTLLFLLFVLVGCTTYDVAAISADIALALFTDVNKDKDPHRDENWFSVWDADTSQCIQFETEKRDIDAALGTIERGREYIILPTGEKYFIDSNPYTESLQPGPTKYCLSDSKSF